MKKIIITELPSKEKKAVWASKIAAHTQRSTKEHRRASFEEVLDKIDCFFVDIEIGDVFELENAQIHIYNLEFWHGWVGNHYRQWCINLDKSGVFQIDQIQLYGKWLKL